METIQLSLLCNDDDDCSMDSRSKADNQLSLLCNDEAFSVDSYDDEKQQERAEI
jgi:hypothetical protein